ncbi:MAG: hypothetical protein EPO24_14985 [Bacteroidetes bacterium]|nr:MAG: hypothetical protein EPO24_14985 [Bacteroidota bacterium]
MKMHYRKNMGCTKSLIARFCVLAETTKPNRIFHSARTQSGARDNTVKEFCFVADRELELPTGPVFFCHSREGRLWRTSSKTGGNPIILSISTDNDWIPAFAGMTMLLFRKLNITIGREFYSRPKDSLLLACVFWLMVIFLSHSLVAKERADAIVAKDGSGQFTSIQAAIDAIPDTRERLWLILIKNGMYNEKIFIRKSNIALVGEHKDTTRIVYAELRENWNRDHNGSDWGAGVVNIDTNANDVILANLTVYNNYGSLYGAFNKHQFAVRGFGTRTSILHCNIVSDGGDALSLWNKQTGMYYHADCYFEGWVDFVCPRGWCYITNSKFFGHNKPSASIWHDGSNDKSQKFVITNSFFDGVSGFPLGRNHLDAAIYLINCRFSANMADRPFFRPPSSPREWQWGDRHYFYNCHREWGDYAWFKDNVETAENTLTPENITAKWTFDGKWNPEQTMPAVLPFASIPSPANKGIVVPASTNTLRWIGGRNAVSYNVYFGTDSIPSFAGNRKETWYVTANLAEQTVYNWRVDVVTEDDTLQGVEWQFTTSATSIIQDDPK